MVSSIWPGGRVVKTDYCEHFLLEALKYILKLAMKFKVIIIVIGH